MKNESNLQDSLLSTLTTSQAVHAPALIQNLLFVHLHASDPAISWYSFEINPSPVTAVVALSCQTARIRPNKQTLLLLLHLAVQPYNYYVGECSMLEYFLLINRKMLSTTTRYTRLFLKTNTFWGQLTFRRRQREIDHCNGHGYT